MINLAGELSNIQNQYYSLVQENEDLVNLQGLLLFLNIILLNKSYKIELSAVFFQL